MTTKRNQNSVSRTFPAIGLLLPLVLLGFTPVWATAEFAQIPIPQVEPDPESTPDDDPVPRLELPQIPPAKPPLQLISIPPEVDPASLNITTANTISQSGVTVPSLWWVNEQFGQRIVENWLAYPRQGKEMGTVDVIVNRQIWSLLDYLQRYEFVNHFGQVARDYQYNIRVFTRQQRLLGRYTCTPEPVICNVWIDSQGLEDQTPSTFGN